MQRNQIRYGCQLWFLQRRNANELHVRAARQEGQARFGTLADLLLLRPRCAEMNGRHWMQDWYCDFPFTPV